MKNALLLATLIATVSAAASEKAATPTKSSKKFEFTDEILDDDGFWTGRIRQHFDELTPSDDAKAALQKRYGEGWDYTLFRDFHGDGRPTALLVRGVVSKAGEPTFLVRNLVIAKLQDDHWTEMVCLDWKKGIALNEGKKTLAPERGAEGYYVVFSVARPRPTGDEEARPALWLRAGAEDAAGDPTGNDVELSYSNATKLYDSKTLKGGK